MRQPSNSVTILLGELGAGRSARDLGQCSQLVRGRVNEPRSSDLPADTNEWTVSILMLN